MNYVSAVYFVVFAFVLVYWVARGKRTFRTRDEREVAVDIILAGRPVHRISSVTSYHSPRD